MDKLEEYMDDDKIYPLCYEIIEKIPINKRTKKLSQYLSNFKDLKLNKKQNLKNQNHNIKRRFTILSSTNKEDLADLEKNLDEPFYADKLVQYLNSQKYLFKSLNL